MIVVIVVVVVVLVVLVVVIVLVVVVVAVIVVIVVVVVVVVVVWCRLFVDNDFNNGTKHPTTRQYSPKTKTLGGYGILFTLCLSVCFHLTTRRSWLFP